jgi:hypothetical protein
MILIIGFLYFMSVNDDNLIIEMYSSIFEQCDNVTM